MTSCLTNIMLYHRQSTPNYKLLAYHIIVVLSADVEEIIKSLSLFIIEFINKHACIWKSNAIYLSIGSIFISNKYMPVYIETLRQLNPNGALSHYKHLLLIKLF